MKNMKILCTTLAAVLVFSSCTRGGGESPAAGAPDDGGAAASSRPTQQETPAIVDAEGYWRANTLPDPVAEQVVRQPAAGGETSAKVQILSLDSDGQNARLVAAVLPPVDGAPISSPLGVAGSKGARQRPWVRLVDGGAQKLYEPLQANGAESRSSADPGDVQDIGEVDDDARKAACICSYGVNAADKDATGAPNRTNLFYVDFPAPAGASVDVLLGDGDAFFSQVPVSSGQRFEADELGRFSFINSGGDALPGRYGAGAKLRRIVDLDESVSSVTDSTVQEKKGTTNLSVGADVLFALDSDKLDARATKVLGSIAKKLATAAKGQTVTIEGHTDDQGAKDYNQGLSERRALAVEKVLRPLVEDAGITLRTKGYGQTGPRVPNKDTKGKPIEANRAKNRRLNCRRPRVG
ncbi:OmpA family protein [Brevibacterium moorei]|uniref:OmpA family protein n=1 Tax=Brevibacterium moorei TaxID=2968457 RepID=UPI0027954C4E|nr:OmpA family protein [Brevibacterium sp. 68QC2CO]